MTQAICDITTDEVNVDVVVEPQADTMVEVANRAGGMEQVFHDNTLIGNGNSVDLGVNTDVIATKEYVDEKVESIDTYTKDQIDGKLTAVDAQIDANADAIQKTREDYIQADSEIHQILNNHAENLTTLHNDVDDLGDQVAEIESKIPESASATNQLATKADLEDVHVDLTGYATTEYVNAREQEIRDDVNQVDSELQSQITAQASAITANTTSINGVKAVIPDGTSDTNPLINKQQLLDEEMDIREDLNSGLSELQTQITAQATAIAGKQDQLTAGDNITIVDNVISATGGGGDFLPLAGGTMTGNINFEYGSGEQFIGASEANGGILIFTRNSSNSRNAYYYFEIFGFYGRNTNGNYNLNLGNNNFPWGRAYIQTINSGNGGADIIVPAEGGTLARLEDLADIGGGGGITNVVHDTTLTGSGTDASPLGLAETIKDEIASKAPTATVEALTQVVNGIIGDYVKKTGDTMTGALNVPEFTVSTAEGTLSISIVAGVATIATNNGLDIVAQTKFDTAPTTDDNTTYANALDTSLVRKAQVATAIADAMANVDALPDQTGNAGKVLTTDGTNASWTEMPGLIIRRL